MYNTVLPEQSADEGLPGLVPQDVAYNKGKEWDVLQTSLISLSKKGLPTQEPGAADDIDTRVQRFRTSMDILLQKSFGDLKRGYDELYEASFLNVAAPPDVPVQQVAQEQESVHMSTVAARLSRRSIRHSMSSDTPVHCEDCGMLWADDAILCRRCGRPRYAFNSAAEKYEHAQILLMQKSLRLHESHERERQVFLKHSFSHRLQKRFEWKRLDLLVDIIALWMIFLNALYMGVVMDANEDPGTFSGFSVIEILFSIFFLFELSLKIYINSLRRFFCGSTRYSAWFDTTIVLLDSVFLVISLAGTSFVVDPGIFRLLRLGKLTRIVRVLRFRGFQTLLSMIQGMIGGMTTLAWSLILYLIVLYTMALIFRESLGREDHPHIKTYFETVPRSLYTTFRCSFGDCNTVIGTPIFEHVQEKYGAAISLLYSIFLFGVTIGLFNVISAIFVESTINASSAFKQQRKKDRLNDELLWASRITTLIRQLLVFARADAPRNLSESIDTLAELEVDAKVVARWAKDEVTKAALRDLEIDPLDDDDLVDILDPDQNGTVTITEVQDGLRRLRGFTRRSDILRVDLMVRHQSRILRDLTTKLENK